jgi:hypothetical protein
VGPNNGGPIPMPFVLSLSKGAEGFDKLSPNGNMQVTG